MSTLDMGPVSIMLTVAQLLQHEAAHPSFCMGRKYESFGISRITAIICHASALFSSLPKGSKYHCSTYIDYKVGIQEPL